MKCSVNLCCYQHVSCWHKKGKTTKENLPSLWPAHKPFDHCQLYSQVFKQSSFTRLHSPMDSKLDWYLQGNILYLKEKNSLVFSASAFGIRCMGLLPELLCCSPHAGVSEHRSNNGEAQAADPAAASFHQNSPAFLVVILSLDIIVMEVFLCVYFGTWLVSICHRVNKF